MPRALSSFRRAAAFTLTELLIAVGVLVVVITAAAKIFSASSKVAAVAEANADLIQTAAAIESQIRADFANIPKNSFMVLQQVEVNPQGSGQDIDPSLGAAEIRADQIAFFTRGVRQTTQYAGSQQGNSSNNVVTNWTAESAVARVYYGHGITAPTIPLNTGPFSYEDKNAPVVPWKGGRAELQRWTDGAAQGVANVPLVRASNWPLVRLSTLLATDGQPTTVDAAGAATNTTLPIYAATTLNASVSLFTNRLIRINPLATNYPNTYAPLWTSGRVDIVKWQPDDLYSQTAFQADAQQNLQGIPFIGPTNSPWNQSSIRLRMIQTLANWAAGATSIPASSPKLYVSYPRVEKAAPSSAKADVMLTAPILAPNCSSFKIEWTWAHGVGRSFAGSSAGNPPQGGESIGMFIRSGSPVPAQPWFGLDNTVSNGPLFFNFSNGSIPPGQWGAVGLPLVVPGVNGLVCSVEGPLNPAEGNRPIWRCDSEQDGSPAGSGKRVYQAVFGLNQDDPTALNPSLGQRGPYTPFPSAIRITLRLHDALGRIEGGREFQFIVDLPRR